MALYGYLYERPARKHFRWWHNWAVRSRLEPFLQVAGMIKRRFENMITYLRRRVTNAGSESINAKVQGVKYTARPAGGRANGLKPHLERTYKASVDIADVEKVRGVLFINLEAARSAPGRPA